MVGFYITELTDIQPAT